MIIGSAPMSLRKVQPTRSNRPAWTNSGMPLWIYRHISDASHSAAADCSAKQHCGPSAEEQDQAAEGTITDEDAALAAAKAHSRSLIGIWGSPGTRQRADRVMSALGQKRTCAVRTGTFALLPKADICGGMTALGPAGKREVRYPAGKAQRARKIGEATWPPGAMPSLRDVPPMTSRTARTGPRDGIIRVDKGSVFSSIRRIRPSPRMKIMSSGI